MTTQRKEIGNEQFFTQPQTAGRLVRLLRQQPWFDRVTRIIEPSAGDAVWLAACDAHDLKVDIALDIDPQHSEVSLGDYLGEAGQEIEYQRGTLTLGNPPFGRMGSMAVKFFNQAAQNSDWIAFILPASFGKRTVQRRLDKRFHCVLQEEMLDETFRFERDGKTVKCVFQIWERRDVERVDPPAKRSTKDFSFVNVRSPSSGSAAPAPSDADLAIRTHGHGYGRIIERCDPNWSKLNSRTHRFIKVNPDSNIRPKELMHKLSALDYESAGKFTVGQSCVSTEEIVMLYEQAYPSRSPKP